MGRRRTVGIYMISLFIMDSRVADEYDPSALHIKGHLASYVVVRVWYT
jgi:hypothetical protein